METTTVRTPDLAPRKTQKTIEMTLMGQKIVLRAPENADTTDAIVDLVKDRIKKAEARMKPGFSAPHLAAVLALFDLAEEYVDAKNRVENHQSDFSDKLNELKATLE